MDKWILDLGFVSLWDDEDETFHKASMKLSYDSSDYLSFEIEAIFENSDNKMICTAKELKIETQDTGIIVINDDIFCVLTVEQKDRLFSAQKEWQNVSLNQTESNPNDRIAGAYAKDFGIVFFYDAEIQNFVTANLKMDFDWNSSQPIILLVDTYDDVGFPMNHNSGQYAELTYSYEGDINGLFHYVICSEHFLLTDKQVNLLNYINEVI